MMWRPLLFGRPSDQDLRQVADQSYPERVSFVDRTQRAERAEYGDSETNEDQDAGGHDGIPFLQADNKASQSSNYSMAMHVPRNDLMQDWDVTPW